MSEKEEHLAQWRKEWRSLREWRDRLGVKLYRELVVEMEDGKSRVSWKKFTYQAATDTYLYKETEYPAEFLKEWDCMLQQTQTVTMFISF